MDGVIQAIGQPTPGQSSTPHSLQENQRDVTKQKPSHSNKG